MSAIHHFIIVTSMLIVWTLLEASVVNATMDIMEMEPTAVSFDN